MKKFLIISLAFLITQFPFYMHAQWDVSPYESLYEFAPGNAVVVEIKLSGSGSEINALGFDFHFPEDLLQFDGRDFNSTLLEPWMYTEVNVLIPDTVRVAGITVTDIITTPAEGILVKLNFTVKENASGEGLFYIDGMVDDIRGATTNVATFKVDEGNYLGGFVETPHQFKLSQNYPNPFNPQTIIKYQLPARTHVVLKIFNLPGQVINILINEEMEAGLYEALWDGKDRLGQKVSSGVYFYRLETAAFGEMKKMSIIR